MRDSNIGIWTALGVSLNLPNKIQVITKINRNKNNEHPQAFP